MVLEYEGNALQAVATAAKRGADVAPLLPAVLKYLEGGLWTTLVVVDILDSLVERGSDIASAVERLTLLAERGDPQQRRRSLALLEKAAERGADLSVAGALLQRLADRGGEEGTLAARIQALAQGRKQSPAPARRREGSKT